MTMNIPTTSLLALQPVWEGHTQHKAHSHIQAHLQLQE